MAELAPVGMFMADSNGKIIFVNDAWYDIAQYPKGTPVEYDWLPYVKEEDQEKCRKIWSTVVNELVPVRAEFRFKHPWKDDHGNTGETWVLASSFPEKTEDGSLKSIFGSVTDISTQKFAEGLQKKRMEEAMEMKRQQENFVDITSKCSWSPGKSICIPKQIMFLLTVLLTLALRLVLQRSATLVVVCR
jgi:PAS domain S-box-containing protein